MVGSVACCLLGLLAAELVDLGWLLLDHHNPGDCEEGCFCKVSFYFGSGPIFLTQSFQDLATPMSQGLVARLEAVAVSLALFLD